MELLRVLRKSVVFIAIFLGIIIWLSIFKINNTNDKKVYAYYNQLMYEYDNQTEMIESLTYSKYVHDKTDDYEADREYIEEAIKLLQEKYQYVYSSDMSRAENNYKKIINSTLFAEEQSYYVLNAQKYMADLESRGEINFSITNTTAIEKLVSDKQLPVIFLVMMIFVLITFMEEFENNMFLQIRGSKNSRKVLPVKRCFIILLISIVLSFVFNGVILAIYKNIYGCNMGSLIQNSYMFNMFQLKTNVATFFIIYCITFAIAMSVLSWLVYFVFLITGNYKLSIAGTGLFLVFEYIININISSKSAFAFLKYINISNVLFPGQSYYIYENRGTDNFITDIQSTTWLLTILLAITGLIGVYITYSHKYAQGRKSAITKIIEIKSGLNSASFNLRFNSAPISYPMRLITTPKKRVSPAKLFIFFFLPSLSYHILCHSSGHDHNNNRRKYCNDNHRHNSRTQNAPGVQKSYCCRNKHHRHNFN